MKRLRSNWIGFVTSVSTCCVMYQVSYMNWMEKAVDYISIRCVRARSSCYQWLFSRRTQVSENVRGVNASHLGSLIEERR